MDDEFLDPKIKKHLETILLQIEGKPPEIAVPLYEEYMKKHLPDEFVDGKFPILITRDPALENNEANQKAGKLLPMNRAERRKNKH